MAFVGFVPWVSAHQAFFMSAPNPPLRQRVSPKAARSSLKLSSLLFDDLVFPIPARELDDCCQQSGISRQINWRSIDELSGLVDTEGIVNAFSFDNVEFQRFNAGLSSHSGPSLW